MVQLRSTCAAPPLSSKRVTECQVAPSSSLTANAKTPRPASPLLNEWLYTISTRPSFSFTASKPVLGQGTPVM
jgi:hypothetical protein